MKIIGIAVFLFVAIVGIAQEITPQRGVSFNATGILPAHDHSSPRNGAISGAAKLAIVNVGDQNTALTLDNTLDGTTRAPFIQFRKRKTAGTPAEVGAVLGQLTFDSSNSAGTSAEIRSTVRVLGSDAGGRPAGASLDFMTAAGDTTAPAQSRLYISETGTSRFTGKVYVSTSVSGNGNLRVRAGNGDAGGTTPIQIFSWVGSSNTANTIGQMVGTSFTIPADTLVNDGDRIEIFAMARATTTSLAKQIELRIDGDLTQLGASTNGARQWTAFGKLWRTSSTNISQYFERQRSDPGGGAGQSVDWDITNTITLASTSFLVEVLIYGVTGATAVGDEDMNLVSVYAVYYPAP